MPHAPQAVPTAAQDPFCPVIRPSREHSDLAGIESRKWEEIASAGFDVALISTAHDSVEHDRLAEWIPLVIDTRGACAPHPNVVKA